MEDNNSARQSGGSPLRLILTLIVIIVVPLALSLFLGSRLLPQPKVGVIRLNYDIAAETADEVTRQLNYARSDDSIKAVVLVINSPGGSAAYSEELYLSVLETRKEKPVVSTVDLLAASGAYFMAAASDEIYAKPTSYVGSIGVIAQLPGQVYIDDYTITTGPYKAFGGTRDGMTRQIEMAKFSFLQAVQAGRGERLKADPAFLSRAEIYTAVQAQDMGLIDGLLSTDEAIERAAELAGISNYEVVELLPLAFPELLSGQSNTDAALNTYRPPSVDPQTLWASPTNLPTGLYYLYIEPGR
ncbi:MAG: S49 family peptidase [Candidatus Promineifilaceae bacterium]